MKSLDLRRLVSNELADRQKNNPRYSLRAFARDASVSVTTISQVLSGKRRFSPKNANLVINELGLAAYVAERTTKKPQKLVQEDYLIHDDEFRVIADWYHLAILNLAKLPNADSNPEKVAIRLGITPLMAANAISRLKRMKLLETKNRRLIRTSNRIVTTTDMPSTAIRNHHQQNLDLAKQALDQVPVELRDYSSVTGPINTKNLANAKALIKEFRISLNKLMEKGEVNEVYTLAIQLFPLTKSRSK